jgi:hypothetical protein
MADVLEIIKGLSQAAANAFDGALTKDGKPQEVGLRREEGSWLGGSRLIDGVNVKFQDNKLIVNYHSEVLMKEVHDKDFETEIKQTIADAVSFLKKEYKSVTKDSVSLKEVKKPIIRVEHTSKIRCWVTAQSVYEIGGIKTQQEKGRTVDSAIKSWLSKGKGGTYGESF